MSSLEMGSVVLTLCVLLLCVHSVGYLFQKIKQPKLIGEILVGVLLGPFILGSLFPVISQLLFGAHQASAINKMDVVLNFIYWTGLMLLMFISGSEARKLVARENRKETAWLLGLGTPLPFFAVMIMGTAGWLPLADITGPLGHELSALLILACASSVTSIPVISRIFYDLRILHTRFASLILGSAVLEDLILWGVLAVATGLAGSAMLAPAAVMDEVGVQVGTTFGYMLLGLVVAPRLLKLLHGQRWNALIKSSPTAYVLFILFAYASLAALLKVNLIFAAFLAGFGVIGGVGGTERERFAVPLDAIANVAFAFFIPLYFAMIGYKLIWGRAFSLPMLLVFLVGSSILALLSVALAARLAGFGKRDVLNLAITTNARGGPGIVLASIAFDAGIINAGFYTTLVLTAILTSQAAGLWLSFVLSRGWPLLSTNPEERPLP